MNENFYLDTVKGRPSAEVFNAILCLYSLLQRASDDYFKPYALTPVKFNTLLLIKYLGRDKGLSQSDISHHLIVTPSNITRLIDRLIKDGYCERTTNKNDRRIKLIKITSKGSKILDEVSHGYGEMIQQTIYCLDRPEVEELSGLLLKLYGKMREK